MSHLLMNSAIVIVARQFNPSIVRSDWLIRNGILGEEDFMPGCVFTDMLVQVRSRMFDLLVAPEQCQLTPLVEPDEQQQLISEKVGTIIRTLPHTPYTALGLNFDWRLSPEKTTVGTLSRHLFFVPESPLHKELDSEDARFGGYVSKDVLGFRMKLNVKPIQDLEDEERQWLQFGFNFHLDLPSGQEDRIATIESALTRWHAARAESERILCGAAKGDTND